MNKWRNLYLHQLSKLQSSVDYPHGVLVGFNVNIDKIIKITPKTLQMLFNRYSFEMEEKSNCFIGKINSENELMICLLRSIQKGEANELLIDSVKVKEWIEKHFSILRSQIGGQAGIISNFLAKLNASRVLLSLPEFNRELVSLLDPKLFVVSAKDEKIRVEDLKGIYHKKEKEFFTHYIFEFEKGVYKLGKTKIVCPRSNRFIASYDTLNTRLMVKTEFIDYSSKYIRDYKLAIVSGFHLIDSRKNILKAKKIFNEVRRTFKKWKKKNPDLLIHLELASTKIAKTKHFISSTLLPFVDSVGLNEQELFSFLKEHDEKTSYILRNRKTIISLFEALLSFFYNHPHLRIHLHYLGFYFIISPPISSELAKKRRDSLISSSLVAASRITNKLFPIEQLNNLKENISLEKSIADLRKLERYLFRNYYLNEEPVKGHFKSSDFSLICVPTIIVKPTNQLVGTGDIISLTSFLFENI